MTEEKWTDIPTEAQLAAATQALRKLGGTYVSKYAEKIAAAALQGATQAVGENRVESVVGHTTTGVRNIQKWTTVARKAAAKVVE